MFSYLMGSFIDILSTYQDLSADLDDGDTLAKFFGMLKHFNDGKALKQEIKEKIEAHFDYFWSNFRNKPFQDEDDAHFRDLLPRYVQDKLYKEFLFTDFFDNFEKKYFLIPKRHKEFTDC